LFYKIGEQKGRTGPVLGVGTSGSGEVVGKGVGGWIWCKYCIHMNVNGKTRPVETSKDGGMGDKGE
jgi:hypothetical protein